MKDVEARAIVATAQDEVNCPGLPFLMPLPQSVIGFVENYQA
jgi:hypothetical protein